MKFSLSQHFTRIFCLLALLFNSFVLDHFAFNETFCLKQTDSKLIRENTISEKNFLNIFLMSHLMSQPFLPLPLFYYPTNTSNIIQNQRTAKISKVEFENLKNIPIDINPGNGKFINDIPISKIGYRIFPDKISPVDKENRAKIKVSATITPQISGVRIYFRSFDMDDPSSTEAPLDDERCIQDNRGEVEGNKEGKLNSDFATTNNQGKASVEFTVTKQPGDNFSVVASIAPIPKVLNLDKNCNKSSKTNVLVTSNLIIDSVKPDKNELILEKINGERKTIPKSFDKTLPYKSASEPETIMRTETLTVWRHLHLEIDDMGRIENPPLTGIVKNVINIKKTEDNYLCEDLGLSNLEPNQYSEGRIIFNKQASFQIIRHGECSLDQKFIELRSDTKQFQSISVGTQYEIFDDDDFNGDDKYPIGDENENLEPDMEIFKHIQDEDGVYLDKTPKNVFAAAYIKPDYEWAKKNHFNQNEVPFILNIDYKNVNFFQDILNKNRDSDGLESNDFWIAYLLISYQGSRPNDCDGQFEDETNPCVGGAGIALSEKDVVDIVSSNKDVPKGVYGSAIFVESLRDDLITNRKRVFDLDVTPPDNDIMFHTAVPHEIGHQFGISGDILQSYKIMSHLSSKIDFEFSTQHLNLIRWRIPSPGTVNKVTSNQRGRN